MKELARIMRFDLLTAAGTPGSMQLALFFSAVSILLGLFFFPLGCVYMVFSIPGMFILPLGSAAEKNGFNKLYGVLPVDRRNITRARFLYIFLVGFAAELTGLLLLAISYSARLYTVLPVTAPDLKEMLVQNFDKAQTLPLSLKAITGAFLVITVLGGVFSMLTMIFGSQNSGRIAAISVTALVVICSAFVFLNELDLVPVIDFKSSLTKDISAAGIIICNLIGLAVCLICGEITAKKLAVREL